MKFSAELKNNLKNPSIYFPVIIGFLILDFLTHLSYIGIRSEDLATFGIIFSLPFTFSSIDNFFNPIYLESYVLSQIFGNNLSNGIIVCYFFGNLILLIPKIYLFCFSAINPDLEPQPEIKGFLPKKSIFLPLMMYESLILMVSTILILLPIPGIISIILIFTINFLLWLTPFFIIQNKISLPEAITLSIKYAGNSFNLQYVGKFLLTGIIFSFFVHQFMKIPVVGIMVSSILSVYFGVALIRLTFKHVSEVNMKIEESKLLHTSNLENEEKLEISRHKKPSTDLSFRISHKQMNSIYSICLVSMLLLISICFPPVSLSPPESQNNFSHSEFINWQSSSFGYTHYSDPNYSGSLPFYSMDCEYPRNISFYNNSNVNGEFLFHLKSEFNYIPNVPIRVNHQFGFTVLIETQYFSKNGEIWQFGNSEQHWMPSPENLFGFHADMSDSILDYNEEAQALPENDTVTYLGRFFVSDIQRIRGYSRIRIMINSTLASTFYNGNETFSLDGNEKTVTKITAVRMIDNIQWQSYWGVFGWVTNKALTFVMGDGDFSDWHELVLAPLP